ncbi:MAG: ribonuclease III [Proteobacteria bacterium]|nr:ribonuclease III [Pseudomonadota bacterium]
MNDLNELESVLGIDFKDTNILRLALTHKSHSFPNNDRLEFLGDSILNSVVTNYLFDKFNDATSGDMSRLKSFLVSGEYLAEIAKKLKLNNYILLGKGEIQSQGDLKPSILSSALEAVIAAIYISNGLKDAKDFILRQFDIDSVPFDIDRNYKGKLQSYVLKRFNSLPLYKTYTNGNGYTSEVIVENKTAALGKGNSKKIAENDAASHALKELNII